MAHSHSSPKKVTPGTHKKLFYSNKLILSESSGDSDFDYDADDYKCLTKSPDLLIGSSPSTSPINVSHLTNQTYSLILKRKRDSSEEQVTKTIQYTTPCNKKHRGDV